MARLSSGKFRLDRTELKQFNKDGMLRLVWLTILENAYVKSAPFKSGRKIITINRGELPITVKEIADLNTIDRKIAKQRLDTLRLMGLIKVEQIYKGMKITIKDYDDRERLSLKDESHEGTDKGTHKGRTRDTTNIDSSRDSKNGVIARGYAQGSDKGMDRPTNELIINNIKMNNLNSPPIPPETSDSKSIIQPRGEEIGSGKGKSGSLELSNQGDGNGEDAKVIPIASKNAWQGLSEGLKALAIEWHRYLRETDPNCDYTQADVGLCLNRILKEESFSIADLSLILEYFKKAGWAFKSISPFDWNVKHHFGRPYFENILRDATNWQMMQSPVELEKAIE